MCVPEPLSKQRFLRPKCQISAVILRRRRSMTIWATEQTRGTLVLWRRLKKKDTRLWKTPFGLFGSTTRQWTTSGPEEPRKNSTSPRANIPTSTLWGFFSGPEATPCGNCKRKVVQSWPSGERARSRTAN